MELANENCSEVPGGTKSLCEQNLTTQAPGGARREGSGGSPGRLTDDRSRGGAQAEPRPGGPTGGREAGARGSHPPIPSPRKQKGPPKGAL